MKNTKDAKYISIKVSGYFMD